MSGARLPDCIINIVFKWKRNDPRHKLIAQFVHFPPQGFVSFTLLYLFCFGVLRSVKLVFSSVSFGNFSFGVWGKIQNYEYCVCLQWLIYTVFCSTSSWLFWHALIWQSLNTWHKQFRESSISSIRTLLTFTFHWLSNWLPASVPKHRPSQPRPPWPVMTSQMWTYFRSCCSSLIGFWHFTQLL